MTVLPRPSLPDKGQAGADQDLPRRDPGRRHGAGARRAGLDALILGTEDEPEPEARFDPPPGLAPDLPASPVSATQAAVSLSRHNLPPALLSALEDGPLDAACSRLFRFSRLPLDADGAPLLLAGPPGGGGKTLTIAKPATRLVMEGHRPLVITVDEQRAGAIEQLAAFTRPLGLTLIAAGRPEMRALGRREALSPVLTRCRPS